MAADPPAIVLSRPVLDAPGLASLGARWRRLEADAAPSPFQSWSWIRCMAARFTDPLLVEAHDGAGPIGMALWNRRRSVFGGVLHLHETGDPAIDAVFTEHNDPLIAHRAAGRDGPLLGMLLAAMRQGRATRLVLSGVGDATLDAAGRTGWTRIPGRDRPAPYLDLTTIPEGGDASGTMSRNARQQVRRSDRAYAAQGALRIERAATAREGAQFLDALIALHTATWQARGKPGAFAGRAVRAFHAELVRDGITGTVELLRCTAGDAVIGYLYNLVSGGHACAYQSGFDYAGAPAHGRPGLTCHHLAIEAHRARGGTVYDFLGGPDRYKRSLANRERTLHWRQLAPAWHPAAVLARLRG